MCDEELLRQFEAADIPRSEWRHRTHVQIAYLYARDYPLPEAIERVRIGIQRLNAANGVEEGPTSGYNETTTVAFMHLVAATLAAYCEALPTPDSDSFCDTHGHLLGKTILRLYYSPERRMHPDAKHRFIEPDLSPLPLVKKACQE